MDAVLYDDGHAAVKHGVLHPPRPAPAGQHPAEGRAREGRSVRARLLVGHDDVSLLRRRRRQLLPQPEGVVFELRGAAHAAGAAAAQVAVEVKEQVARRRRGRAGRPEERRGAEGLWSAPGGENDVLAPVVAALPPVHPLPVRTHPPQVVLGRAVRARVHASPVHQQGGAAERGGRVAGALVVHEGPEVIGAARAVPVRVVAPQVRQQSLVPPHGANGGEVGDAALGARVAQPVDLPAQIATRARERTRFARGWGVAWGARARVRVGAPPHSRARVG